MQHRHLRPLMMCVLAFALVASTKGENKAEAWREKAQDLAAPVIEAELTPGMVLGIYYRGDVAFVGVGQLSPRDDSTPTADTVYEIGSISKTFTGVLLADAVVRGEMALDDPLSAFMPEDLTAPTHQDGPITLEDLATHRSALPRMPLNLGAVDPGNPYATYTEDKLWAMIDTCTLTRPPGSVYVYSNLAMGLLGTILANQADMTYEELLRTRICDPLDMTDTSIVLSDAQRSRLAPPHMSGGVPSSNWDFDCLAPCGGIRSTARDMMRYIAAHLDPDAAGDLADALDFAIERRGTLPDGRIGIALGWHIAGDRVGRWHNGQTGGYHSMVLFNREFDLGVVALSNSTDATVEIVAERLLQAMAGMDVQPPNVRPAVPLEDEQIDRLLGDYRYFGLTFTISRDGSSVFAQLTGQPALRIYPESPTRFFYREVEASLQFAFDDEVEHAVSVTLFQGGREMKFVRNK